MRKNSYHLKLSQNMLRYLPKSKYGGMLDGGKFVRVHKSLHKSKWARKYNAFWRLIYNMRYSQ